MVISRPKAPLIDRPGLTTRVRTALERSRAVALIGPRQVGKTTLARGFLPPGSANYFDLEDPRDLQRIAQPMTAIEPLRGLVVIDEVQRRPDLFPVLRVLIDREGAPARFLVLGSASPALLRQSSESLARRLEVVEMAGLSLPEVGVQHTDTLWLRGGIPLSFLARTDTDSGAWREGFIRLTVERDLPGWVSAHPLWRSGVSGEWWRITTDRSGALQSPRARWACRNRPCAATSTS